MASVFGHLVAGFTISKLTKWKAPMALTTLATLSAFLPDADVVSFQFGIAYEHWAGHRGFTHSILFAVLWGAICAFFFKQRLLAFITIMLATLSHPLLDGLTTGGLGCAFFFPFDNDRYFLPWRVIKVSPIGIDRFLSERGMQVIWSELLWVGIPCAALLIIKKIFST